MSNLDGEHRAVQASGVIHLESACLGCQCRLAHGEHEQVRFPDGLQDGVPPILAPSQTRIDPHVAPQVLELGPQQGDGVGVLPCVADEDAH